MERPVVVALLDRGELQSVRTLSPERERSAALWAAAGGAGLVLAAMALAAGLVKGFGLVVHAPTFFLSWLGRGRGGGRGVGPLGERPRWGATVSERTSRPTRSR